MILMSVPSVLFIGALILSFAIVGFGVGFVTGLVAQWDNRNLQGRVRVVMWFGVLILVALASIALSGCSPVVKESITITDTERTLPVPGDTVSMTARSDSFVVRPPSSWFIGSPADTGWIPFTPAETREIPVAPASPLPVYFRASVDTTVGGVRLRVGYSYPEDLFDILVEQARRDVKYRDRDTSGSTVVERTRDVVPFWVYLVIVCAIAMMVYSVVLTIKART